MYGQFLFCGYCDVYTVKESLDAAEAKSKELVETYTAGIAEAGDDPYKVPDSEVELTKESTEQDIGKAAVAVAFAAVDKDELKVYSLLPSLNRTKEEWTISFDIVIVCGKANIWKEIESDLDKQIEAMEEEKRPDKDEIEKTKKDIKDRDVDEKVDSEFTTKQTELEKSYDPEPEKPAEDEEPEKKDDEKAEEAKEDAAEDAPAEEAAAEDAPAEDAPADDAAKEEDKAAEDAPKEEDKAAEEPAAEEEAAAEEPAAEEAAKEE